MVDLRADQTFAATLEISPRSRFDVIDVQRAFEELSQGVLDLRLTRPLND